MLKLNGERSRRRNQCDIDRCGGRDTIMYYRGRSVGTPIHICSDCVHDIVSEYVRIVGVDEAYSKLRDVVDAIAPKAVEKEEKVEEKPKKKGGKAE